MIFVRPLRHQYFRTEKRYGRHFYKKQPQEFLNFMSRVQKVISKNQLIGVLKDITQATSLGMRESTFSLLIKYSRDLALNYSLMRSFSHFNFFWRPLKNKVIRWKDVHHGDLKVVYRVEIAWKTYCLRPLLLPESLEITQDFQIEVRLQEIKQLECGIDSCKWKLMADNQLNPLFDTIQSALTVSLHVYIERISQHNLLLLEPIQLNDLKQRVRCLCDQKGAICEIVNAEVWRPLPYYFDFMVYQVPDNDLVKPLIAWECGNLNTPLDKKSSLPFSILLQWVVISRTTSLLAKKLGIKRL